jgi:small subunit ribosomal protein S21
MGRLAGDDGFYIRGEITGAWRADDIGDRERPDDREGGKRTGRVSRSSDLCFGHCPATSARQCGCSVLWPLYPVLPEQFVFMQIIVRDNNVDQALRALKKKLQREGVYREMKLRRHYEKPSEKRARERAAAVRRARKLERKRAERDGAR